MPMSRRAMFWRMVISSILRRRSRVLIAILAVAIGATTLSGLVTIAVDAVSYTHLTLPTTPYV